MKHKTKKILLVTSISTIAIGAIVGLNVAYFTTSSIQPVTSKGVYVYRQNTSLSTYGYKYDMSATYGQTQSNSLGVLITNNLIHLKNEGKFVANREGKIIKPSFQSYEFGIGNAIVLKFKNSKNEILELTFNSDKAEIENIPINNRLTVIEKDSNDPFSINNKNVFLSLISVGALDGKDIKSPKDIVNPKTMINSNGEWKLRELGFTIKPNIKWVNSEGKLTNYNVVIKDFWYSFMRTKLFDRDFRRQNGGSKQLDQYFIKKTSATTRFNDNDRFPNEYLFSFFDIDSSKLYDEKTAITKTQNGIEMLTFTAFDNVDRPTGFISILKKFLINSFTFSAAPSELIDELANDSKLNDNLIKITDDNNDSKWVGIEGLARKFGIYTYGQDRKSTLYASPYIPKSAIENREVFEYNKHYANQEWVSLVENGKREDNKIKKALNKVIFEYSGGIETGTYNSQLLSSYLKGIVSEIKYSDLLPVQREKIYGSNIDKIAETATKNGLQYTKTINTSTLVQRTLVQSNPINGVSIGSYGFNNDYSQLVFGRTLEELSKGDKTTTNEFFINDGFEFRMLIQAAINWDTFINNSYQHQRIMWLNGAAQDAQFSSVNPDSKTPIQFENVVNTLQFFDRTNGELKLVEINADEMREWTKKNPDNQLNAMKSPKFDLIRKNIKLLLDKKNITKEKSISWNVVYPWSDKDTIKTKALEYVVETINQLDERLLAKLVIPKDRDEMLATISQNTGVSDFNGWGYDYEGIGSYIAAFSNGHGVTILNAFPIYSLENQNDERYNRAIQLQKMFPQFTKLAKFTKKYIDKEMQAKNIDKQFWLENWDKVTNTANQDSSSYFLSVTNKKFDPAVSLAKAFKTYEEEKISDLEWATLIKELNAIKGVSLNADNSILDPKTANLSLYLKDYVVPLTKYGILYFQDYLTVNDEK